MKVRQLSKTDKELYGADVMVVMDFNDVAALGAATSGTLALLPGTTAGLIPTAGTSGTDTIPAGTKVSLTGYRLDTAFVSSTAAGLTLKVGDGGDDDRFLVATQMQSGQTPVSYHAGTIATNNFAYLAADTVDATLTATTANFNTFTAGQVSLFFRADNLNDWSKS